MQEITLSNDLNIITAEIRSWKSFAGMSIWEIGKRIKHVKDNNLAHGQYIKWLESIGFDRTEASRYIKIAEELPNDDNWQHLSARAMYLISTLPNEQKQEQIKRVENGEIPRIKEIEELKKRNKEQEQQLKAKNEQIELQSKMIDDLNEKEPQVIEREVTIEKIPDDYNELKRQANSIVNIEEENRLLKKEKERLEQESRKAKEELQTKRKAESDELEQAQLARLQRDADINVHKLIINMNDFVKEQSVTVYDSAAIAGATAETKEKLTQSIKRVESLLKDIKQEIGGEVTWIIN